MVFIGGLKVFWWGKMVTSHQMAISWSAVSNGFFLLSNSEIGCCRGRHAHCQAATINTQTSRRQASDPQGPEISGLQAEVVIKRPFPLDPSFSTFRSSSPTNVDVSCVLLEECDPLSGWEWSWWTLQFQSKWGLFNGLTLTAVFIWALIGSYISISFICMNIVPWNVISCSYILNFMISWQSCFST